MGMFDELRCKYPLPIPEAQDFLFQTKDTPAQYLDQYEIREDGTLWHEAYDHRVEDCPEDNLLPFRLCRDNIRWEQERFEGELEAHHMEGEPPDHKWYSFRFWFREGVVRDVISRVT